MSSNDALSDEVEALSSIYDSAVLELSAVSSNGDIAAVLSLPNVEYSFNVTFPSSYPDEPPHITGTYHVTASARKGEGEAAANILREVLGRIYMPGAVCLFELVEEASPLLQEHHQAQHGPPQDIADHSASRSASPSRFSDVFTESSLTTTASTTASSIPPPQWTLSEPLVVHKSTFVARSLAVSSLKEATESISHLLATNKKVASATHNITAWRIKSQEKEGSPEIVIQDCDDDGETAAGGRVLNLMQLMDVWNAVVIVTRWYGGVKLGPDRFRCINNVAREALVNGGFGKDEKEKSGGKKGRK